jgi:hypothetical protein
MPILKERSMMSCEKTSVAARLKQAPACTVIELSDGEKNIYTGAGWKLARFVDGELVALHDPMDTECQRDTQATAERALVAALDWMRGDGEYWSVMCSCYQLCDPVRIDPNDARGIARMGRLIADQVGMESA